MGWVIWAVIAVALAGGEVLTPGLFFPVHVASRRRCGSRGRTCSGGAVGSPIVFIVCSIASSPSPSGRTPPRAPPALSRTGTDALVGRKAVVTRKVDAMVAGCPRRR
jgi:membrane protein implicated in regulation of membrane protease activity